MNEKGYTVVIAYIRHYPSPNSGSEMMIHKSKIDSVDRIANVLKTWFNKQDRIISIAVTEEE